MTTRSDSVARASRHRVSSVLTNFLAGKAAKKLIKTIDANRSTTVVSPHGIRFIFPPQCFSDLSGAPVSGEVQLHLCEVFGKSQMILTNLGTTSENRLLESAGQFYLQATQDGKPLKLIQPVSVEMPVVLSLSNKIAVKLFSGSFSTMLAFNDDHVFDWRLADDRSLPIRKVAEKKYYHFEISEFNWYGCHYFYPKKTTRTMVGARAVSVIESFDDQAAFLVFDDIPSVVRMYDNGNGFTALNIPVNLAAKVILLALKEEQLYFGSRPIENTYSQKTYVELEPVSEERLLEKLRQL